MDHRVLANVPWTVFTYASAKVVTVLTTIVLARLLNPADFGLVALAMVLIGLLSIFRDLGIGGSLVLAERLDRGVLGTALTLLLGAGVATGVLVAALAPALSNAFDEPDLEIVLFVLAPTIAIGLVGWYYEIRLQRDLQFARRFVAQISQVSVLSATSIALAVAGAGLWSLVIGQVAATVVYAVVLAVLVIPRVAPTFERRTARGLVRSGRGFFAQSWVSWINQNADYTAVGVFLGPKPLGFYSMAYRLSEIPSLSITDSVAKVTFPAFARMRSDPAAVDRPFLEVLRVVTFVALPVSVLLSACSEPFVYVVLGEKWSPMIAPLYLLALWGAIRSPQLTIAWLLNSLGLSGTMARLSALALAVLVPSVFLAAAFGDITLVAGIVLVDVVFLSVIMSVITHRRTSITVHMLWASIRTPIFGSIPAWLAAWLVVQAVSDDHRFLQLIGGVLIGSGAYLLMVLLLDRPLLMTAAGLVRALRQREQG